MFDRLRVSGRRLIENRDTVIAYAAAIAAVFLLFSIVVFERRPQLIAAGALFLVFCLIWLVIRNKASLRDLDSISHYNAYLAFSILFVLFFTLSILSVHFRPDLYSRPMVYYVLVALAAGTISAEVLIAPRGKKFVFLPLLQIIVLGLSMQLTEASIFSGLIGVDPWNDHLFVLALLNSGHVPLQSPTGYSYFPLFFIQNAATSLLTGLSYGNAAIICGGAIQVILDVLFVYLLGSYLVNRKVGALAAVLMVTANQFVIMGIWVIPNTVAATLALGLVYTLFRFTKDRSLQGLAIAALLGAGLILWHPLTSFATMLILFVGFVACVIFGANVPGRAQRPVVSFSFALLYSVELFSWWTYSSGYINRLTELTGARYSPSLFVSAPAQISAFYATVPKPPEAILVNGAIFLFMAGGFLGCLFMISKRFSNPIAATTAVIGLFVAGLVPLAVLSNTYIIDERWVYFAEIFLAIPLAIGFFALVTRSRRDALRVALLMSLVVVLAFTMIVSPYANMDNNTLSPNTIVRYAYTDSELAFIDFAQNHAIQNVSTDEAYQGVLVSSATNTSLQNVSSLDSSLQNATFAHNQSLIVIRSYVVSNAFKEYGVPYRITYDPNVVLANSRFNIVYDDGGVRGYT